MRRFDPSPGKQGSGSNRLGLPFLHKPNDFIGHLFRLIDLRQMAAPGDSNHPVVRKPLPEPVQVGLREPSVIFTPEDQGRLSDFRQQSVDLSDLLRCDSFQEAKEIFTLSKRRKREDDLIDKTVRQELLVIEGAAEDSPGGPF